MLTKHYAPKHPLFLVNNIENELKKYNQSKVGIISFSKKYSEVPDNQQFILSKKQDLGEAARNLFAAMRQIDELDIEMIFAEKFPNTGLGYAINDRLKRASIQD
jgi:L-threonylcarbamoyladenylate synthase